MVASTSDAEDVLDQSSDFLDVDLVCWLVRTGHRRQLPSLSFHPVSNFLYLGRQHGSNDQPTHVAAVAEEINSEETSAHAGCFTVCWEPILIGVAVPLAVSISTEFWKKTLHLVLLLPIINL
jgi:hypothetical protein